MNLKRTNQMNKKIKVLKLTDTDPTHLEELITHMSEATAQEVLHVERYKKHFKTTTKYMAEVVYKLI
jgi:hypothetical protein